MRYKVQCTSQKNYRINLVEIVWALKFLRYRDVNALY
jgi:hypothetical protein